MNIKNIISAIRFQFGKEDWFTQWFIKRNAWGIFSKWSHIKKDGTDKQKYPRVDSASRASEKMTEKYDGKFAHYKCAFCDGYHIGKQMKP